MYLCKFCGIIKLYVSMAPDPGLAPLHALLCSQVLAVQAFIVQQLYLAARLPPGLASTLATASATASPSTCAAPSASTCSPASSSSPSSSSSGAASSEPAPAGTGSNAGLPEPVVVSIYDALFGNDVQSIGFNRNPESLCNKLDTNSEFPKLPLQYLSERIESLERNLDALTSQFNLRSELAIPESPSSATVLRDHNSMLLSLEDRLNALRHAMANIGNVTSELVSNAVTKVYTARQSDISLSNERLSDLALELHALRAPVLAVPSGTGASQDLDPPYGIVAAFR